MERREEGVTEECENEARYCAGNKQHTIPLGLCWRLWWMSMAGDAGASVKAPPPPLGLAGIETCRDCECSVLPLTKLTRFELFVGSGLTGLFICICVPPWCVCAPAQCCTPCCGTRFCCGIWFSWWWANGCCFGC